MTKLLKNSLSLYEEQIKCKEKKITVYDGYEQPIHNLNVIRENAEYAFRNIKRKMPDQSEFNNELKKYFKIENDEDFNSKTIKKSETIDFFTNFFDNKIKKKLNKTTFEGFLSIFTFNKFNFTTLPLISDSIFE